MLLKVLLWLQFLYDWWGIQMNSQLRESNAEYMKVEMACRLRIKAVVEPPNPIASLLGVSRQRLQPQEGGPLLGPPHLIP